MICKGDFKNLIKRIQWRFLLALTLGMLASFATLAKLIVWLLDNHKQPTLAFFFGLIIASIITVNRQMKKWTIGGGISFLISAAVAFGIISLVPVNSGSQWYMMMLYGAICIIAMILPGLSGSFLLLIFGQYNKIWTMVGNIARFQFNCDEILMLLYLVIGCAAGLGAFVH
jgi:putative membrane protein